MTKLTYDVQLHGRTVKNVSTYDEAKSIVAKLGDGWSYKARYTDFDPDDTPERREAMRKHAEKVQAVLALKRELKHAPRYVNISGVGPT